MANVGNTLDKLNVGSKWEKQTGYKIVEKPLFSHMALPSPITFLYRGPLKEDFLGQQLIKGGIGCNCLDLNEENMIYQAATKRSHHIVVSRQKLSRCSVFHLFDQ